MACTTTRSKAQLEELTSAIRAEVRSAMENDDTIEKLVSAIKHTLISEMTPIITQKVSDTLNAAFELELQARDARIAALESKLKHVTLQNEEAEQYSRRNCLIFHGLPESENENTDEVVVKLCKEKLNIQMESRDLDRSHRLGRQKGGKPRGIIAKFANYHCRDKIYRARKLLRNLPGTPVYIHESLTRMRSELLWKVKSDFAHVVKVAWTQDGRIFALLKKGEKRVTIRHNEDLQKLTNPT